MSANIYQDNVYSLKVPMWHNKGVVGEVEESALSVYGRMKPVSFETRPFGIILNGAFQETKDFAIVRIADKEAVVGTTRGSYKLTQPVRYAELFDTYVGKPVETMGFLGSKGQKMFVSWDLPNIDVHGDTVKLYGFMAVGFDGKFGERLYQTAVRVVCQNTWSMAVNEKGSSVYAAKHTMNDHEERLGIWMRYMSKEAEKNVAIHQALFRKMEETPIGIDTAYSLFAKVYPKRDSLGDFHPDELRNSDQVKIDDYNAGQEEKRDLAISLFKGAGIQITPTVWGAFNSVTETENHKVASKKDKTESILLGNRQTIMANAMSVMSEYVQVR